MKSASRCNVSCYKTFFFCRPTIIEAFIILYDTASYKHYGREVGMFNQPYPCCRVALQRCNKEYNT